MVLHRENLALIPAYRQGAIPADDAVKLTSNENPYGPLPAVRAAVEAELDSFNLYPDMAAASLVAAIADHHGVTPAEIALGAGSVEVAGQLMNAMSGPGTEVMFAWRSFEAYPILARVAGAEPIMVPLTADERHDLDAMAAAITDRTRLILLCNPNNPTGTDLSAVEVEAFLARVPSDILVVIDEAYVEFNRDPHTAIGMDFYRAYPNVAVLHTFSKAHGLAGLRVGYAVAREDVATNLRKVAVTFGVTNLAQKAAIASLAAETEMTERVDAILEERARVSAALTELGWHHQPSQANFVWLRTSEHTERIAGELTAQGVLTRAFPGDGIRITIASPEANTRLIDALASIERP